MNEVRMMQEECMRLALEKRKPQRFDLQEGPLFITERLIKRMVKSMRKLFPDRKDAWLRKRALRELDIQAYKIWMYRGLMFLDFGQAEVFLDDWALHVAKWDGYAYCDCEEWFPY